MNLEQFREERKARLANLKEALSNLPELSDDKAHIEVDVTTGDAINSSEEREEKVKEAFKEKNKETKEFVKKQDEEREVDKEEKSENRLMLDESLFKEDYSDGNKFFAVVKEDGSFAGVPCYSFEEAVDLSNQHEGSHIFEMKLAD